MRGQLRILLSHNILALFSYDYSLFKKCQTFTTLFKLSISMDQGEACVEK